MTCGSVRNSGHWSLPLCAHLANSRRWAEPLARTSNCLRGCCGCFCQEPSGISCPKRNIHPNPPVTGVFVSGIGEGFFPDCFGACIRRREIPGCWPCARHFSREYSAQPNSSNFVLVGGKRQWPRNHGRDVQSRRVLVRGTFEMTSSAQGLRRCKVHTAHGEHH